MRKREWSLVTFTLLVQMAIGFFLLFTLFRFVVSESINKNFLDHLSSISFVTIILFLVVGVLAATFHLGQPIHARLAMANFKKSWLSREMILGITFGVTMLVLSLFHWLKIEASFLYTLIHWIGVIVGISLLYAIARIYMLRTVHTWNSIIAPLSFLCTSILLGSILLGLIAIIQPTSPLTASNRPAQMGNLLRWISLASLVLMFLQILLSYSLMRRYHTQIHPMENAFGIPWTKYRLLFMLRLGLGVISIALYISIMDQIISDVNSAGLLTVLLFTSSALVFLAELVGRILFYASYKSAGI